MIGLAYPEISPIALSLGPIAIRWYSLAYLGGILLGWYLAVKNNKKYHSGFEPKQLEDLVFYITLGVIIGGRLGYALFYGGAEMWLKPWHLLELWKGGMSFHGGVIGVIISSFCFAKKYNISFFKITDLVALYAPIGLFLGRLANFVNDELWGRETDVAWAVRFPNGGYVPRHPSQLYEAFLEGIVLFCVLNLLWKLPNVRKHSGLISGLFILLYAVFRGIVELYRQPDAQLGFLFFGLTMGQLLSVPLFIVGMLVVFYTLKKN